MANFQEILNFWFGSPDRSNYGKPRAVWFSKNAEFDRQVKTRFLSDYELAASGKLNHWQDRRESCLALIILCDQFPGNMFGDRPKAFASDPQALGFAEYAVKRGFARQKLPVQRWFFYLPFQRSTAGCDRLVYQFYNQLVHQTIVRSVRDCVSLR